MGSSSNILQIKEERLVVLAHPLISLTLLKKYEATICFLATFYKYYIIYTAPTVLTTKTGLKSKHLVWN